MIYKPLTTSRWPSGKRQRDSAAWVRIAVATRASVKSQEYVDCRGLRGISRLTSVVRSPRQMWVSDILCVIGWLCIAFAKIYLHRVEDLLQAFPL
ncbi:hypothetical protein YC2023_025651 [Brassica napus]